MAIRTNSPWRMHASRGGSGIQAYSFSHRRRTSGSCYGHEPLPEWLGYRPPRTRLPEPSLPIGSGDSQPGSCQMYFVDMLLMINLIAMGWDVATDDFLESQLRVRHLKSYQNCLSSCRIRCTSPYFKGFFATSSDNYPDEIGISRSCRVSCAPVSSIRLKQMAHSRACFGIVPSHCCHFWCRRHKT